MINMAQSLPLEVRDYFTLLSFEFYEMFRYLVYYFFFVFSLFCCCLMTFDQSPLTFLRLFR